MNAIFTRTSSLYVYVQLMERLNKIRETGGRKGLAPPDDVSSRGTGREDGQGGLDLTMLDGDWDPEEHEVSKLQ